MNRSLYSRQRGVPASRRDLQAFPLLSRQEHRPWPAPRAPWIMEQVWRDLLFAHWAVPVQAVRPLVPEQLPLDTYEGHAWISLAPFHMSVRIRGLPILPGMSAIPELNCRTYVTVHGKPGVYFFSLDTRSRMAVWAARSLYHLPYYRAQMRMVKGADLICYSSMRDSAQWSATYGPSSQTIRAAQPGSLEYFLTERYCLYAMSNDRVYRGEIHHLPWALQEACAAIEENTIGEAAGLTLRGAPNLSSFTSEIRVLIWPLTLAES